MTTMLIKHHVKDYKAWRKGFDSFQDFRSAQGSLGSKVYRDVDDPSGITVLLTWDKLDNAKKYAQSPELKSAMEKAGVDVKPMVSFLEAV
jgi:heme-degrading monooxygenase HmoA